MEFAPLLSDWARKFWMKSVLVKKNPAYAASEFLEWETIPYNNKFLPGIFFGDCSFWCILEVSRTRAFLQKFLFFPTIFPFGICCPRKYLVSCSKFLLNGV